MNFPVFDLHCDTALRLLGDDVNQAGSLNANGGHIDLTRAKQLSGYCQCFACFTTPYMEKKDWYGLSPVVVFEREIATIQREIDKNYRTIGEWFVSEYEGEIPDAVRDLVEAVNTSKAKIAELGQDVTVEDNSKSITNPKTGAVVDVVNVKYIYHKQLRMTRPAFGGNIIATIACLQHRPQMATVRPGVMQALAADDSRKGEVIKLDIKPTNNVEVLETVKSTKTSKDITEAKILVSAGRGIGSAEKVAMVQDLADALDGDIACSRAVIDAGWMDKDRQVGQTGKTVRPELYVACGISGAIQHAAGMEGSDYIIAINKEETAPIFDIADLGIIGDVNAILPS